MKKILYAFVLVQLLVLAFTLGELYAIKSIHDEIDKQRDKLKKKIAVGECFDEECDV